MSEITRLLSAIERCDPSAAEQLLPVVYQELRKLAAAMLAQEKPGQTLQATALVHEAYLRLVGAEQQSQSWNSRGHFFAAAAEAMRRILVEQARRRNALKRGGGMLEHQALGESALVSPAPDDQLIAVHEALEELASRDPQAASLVKLRFFAGLSAAEAAEVLGLSVRSAHDVWAYARSWLHRYLRPD